MTRLRTGRNEYRVVLAEHRGVRWAELREQYIDDDGVLGSFTVIASAPDVDALARDIEAQLAVVRAAMDDAP